MSIFRIIFVFFVSIIVSTTPQAEVTAANAYLRPVSTFALDQHVLSDEQLFDQKDQILSRTISTIQYLSSTEAKEFYSANFDGQFSVDLIRDSLIRFYLILLFSPDSLSLGKSLQENFEAFQSVGQDGRGSVRFTGYFQPVYKASRTRSEFYKYPLYKKSADFDAWATPHPKRVELEGYDGLGIEGGQLQGQELAWLSSRYDVFMVQIQGSAILQLPDGNNMSIGFAAGTDYPFTGVGAGFLKEHNVAWHKLGEFFQIKPELLNQIMSRNNRFILFEEKPSPHAIGSLGVPVLSERAIATDRLKLPPGAVALIHTQLPIRNDSGQLKMVKSSRLVLNLDTGSALKGPGRVDLFMGTGDEAKERASAIYNTGELYYLFVR